MPSVLGVEENIHQRPDGMQFQIGSVIIIHSLQTSSLNDKLGVIIGFNDRTHWFAVKLANHDGPPKLLRGSNLQVIDSD
eukprot:6098974-Karenia_brevis.AAC.1